ncbi:MAG: ABC transporter permease [Bacteroidetes bacterium]|nr:ABC transporter permease [Bacteroidota bacterium]
MGSYVLRRILIFIPVLIVISMITFWLSEKAPGDRVQDRCGEGLSRSEYNRCARLYGLDQASFYFSIQPKAYPDSLYRFVRPNRIDRIKSYCRQTGDWDAVEQWEQNLWNFNEALSALPDSIDRQLGIDIRAVYTNLQLTRDLKRVKQELSQLKAYADTLGITAFSTKVGALTAASEPLFSVRNSRAMYIPRFVWHGVDNRYHRWFSSFIRLDFGVSLKDSQPVSRKLGHALYWTLLLNGFSFFLAFLIAIPVGVRAALKVGGRFDRISSSLFFMLYSLPRFWIATILVVFFTTSYYGDWMDIFASIGMGSVPDDASWMEAFRIRAGHFVLPVICQTYGLLAYISRQMRGGMLETIRKDYIRTARAKGLPENKVIWKHALRNALFPMITIFGAVLPAAIAGSVIIEVIFSIPGMGLLMFEAVFANDWPVLFAGLMLGALLTLLGVLLADLMYAWADPAVRFAGGTKSKGHGGN